MDQTERLLSTVEAAAYLDTADHTLEVWRSTRRHAIPYIKIGRNVRYRKSDLDKWMQSRLVAVNAEESLP
jgi:excisionase family DNA binding protein